MNPYKILVADDDADLLASIQIRLSSEGYDVVCAQDGYQAVHVAVRQEPDLLILDINMPAGNGFSVLDRLWKSGLLRNIPVIYMTGDRSLEVLEKIQSARTPLLLKKPFYTADLLGIVQDALVDYAGAEKPLVASAPPGCADSIGRACEDQKAG